MNRFFLIRKQEGSSIVMVGLSLLVLIAIMGLVIDGGSLYMEKSNLQKVANAAALSGAQELTVDENSVRTVVNNILDDHTESASLESISVMLKDEVRVKLTKDVPMYFSKLFGYESAPVKVQSAAEILPMSEALGAAPLGIDDSISLEFYKEYRLKVGPQDNDSGVFGILALGATGSKTYEENLRNGYQNKLTIDDVIDTETGNVAGKTRTVINDLVNSCSVSAEEMIAGANPRDCGRILLIPVFTPEDGDQNQLKSIRITGFSYFYVLEPMDPQSTEIVGMFVERAGTGIVDPTIVNKGAYGIRLTE